MQHHKIFRLNATLIIFRVALSFTFHKVCLACEKIKKSLPKTIKIVYNIYVTNMLD